MTESIFVSFCLLQGNGVVILGVTVKSGSICMCPEFRRSSSMRLSQGQVRCERHAVFTLTLLQSDSRTQRSVESPMNECSPLCLGRREVPELEFEHDVTVFDSVFSMRSRPLPFRSETFLKLIHGREADLDH